MRNLTFYRKDIIPFEKGKNYFFMYKKKWELSDLN